jgi:hypothetical protein
MNLRKITSCRLFVQLGVIAFVAFAPSAGLAAAKVKVAKPRIVVQPVATVTADFGSVVTLTAVATSVETPSYVWTKDGAVVTGATTNSLPITVDEMADAGRYQVTVINGAGAVKSKVSLLRINLAPASLPAGTALIGTMRTTFAGESSVEDGSYVIGTGNAIDDPEDDTEILTYTYSRLSDTQARLVVRGSYYWAEYGIRPEQTEEFLFTFTFANPAGAREATVRYGGALTVVAGNKSKTFKLKGAGAFSFVPPGLEP